MIILYTLTDCVQCSALKAKLQAAGYEFEEEDMSTAESLTELRLHGCFALLAPVLRVDDEFYEWCDCKADGFFAEIFGMKPDQQEVPEIDGRMTSSEHEVYTGTRFQEEHLR